MYAGMPSHISTIHDLLDAEIRCYRFTEKRMSSIDKTLASICDSGNSMHMYAYNS